MYKFRTMTVARPGDERARITGGRDTRVFPWGRLLRRLKVDELPQLINVVTGDMAIVGPRPEDPTIVERDYAPWMHETLTVLPGLTSPGTLGYYADESGLPEDPAAAERIYLERLLPRKLAIDLVYVRNRTARYDAMLVVRTLAGVAGLTSLFRRSMTDESARAERDPAGGVEVTGSVTSPRRIVLIGAARSGTKIMRDTLSRGHRARERSPSTSGSSGASARTSLTTRCEPGSLGPRERAFIARYVDRYAAGQPPSVIEKTVGNALRVPFVASVFPDATFVHLVRNGVDVAESTMRQWHEPADFRYLASKLRHFPPRLLPSYGRTYATSLLRRRTSGEGRVSTLGAPLPRHRRRSSRRGTCSPSAPGSGASRSRARRATSRPSVRRSSRCATRTWSTGPATCSPEWPTSAALPAREADLARAAERLSPGRSGQGTRSLAEAQLATLDAEIGDVMEAGIPPPRTGARRMQSR